ncbi:hypothetical protein [Egicoccus sp. AB-alg2]|uniref:hypothetical protein n=1 Tax=Egicoccus sp. AB-alg2 TaxID=3242693 RepID=UPI00359EB13D
MPTVWEDLARHGLERLAAAPITTGPGRVPMAGFPYAAATALAAGPDGEVWAIALSRLYQLQHGRWHRHTPELGSDRPLFDVAVAADGVLWGDANGYFRFIDGGWELVGEDRTFVSFMDYRLYPTPRDASVGAVAGIPEFQRPAQPQAQAGVVSVPIEVARAGGVTNAAGQLWSLTDSAGRWHDEGCDLHASHWDGDRWHKLTWRGLPRISDLPSSAIAVSVNGSLRIGIQGGFATTEAGGAFLHFHTTDLLAGEEVDAVIDSFDGIWCLTASGRLAIKRSDGWHATRRHLPQGDLNRPWVALHAGGDRLRLVTRRSVVPLNDGERDHPIDPVPGETTKIRASAVSDDGSLWVAHDRGVTRFGPGSTGPQILADGLPPAFVWHLTAMRDGTLVAVTPTGIAVHHGDRWHLHRTEGGVLWAGSTVAGTVVVYTRVDQPGEWRPDAGRLWTFTLAAGLSVRELPSGGPMPLAILRVTVDEHARLLAPRDGRVFRLEASGWVDTQVFAAEDGNEPLAVDGEVVWVAWDGLNRHPIGGYNHRVGDHDDLPTECRDLQVDQQGRVWARTEDGIHRYDPETGWAHHTLGTGLPATRSVRDLTVATDGSPWAVLDGGVVAYRDGTWQSIAGTEKVYRLGSGLDGHVYAADPEGILRLPR